jgi:cytochrome c-type biogenesis protein
VQLRDILFGGTVLAAFIGGVVALLAPCCISVMLPAYFATTFRRRRALIAMTFVFALGVAAVILPIAFGASAVTRFIVGRHLLVFLGGAVLMVALGVSMLLGWKLRLPAPGMGARQDRGPLAVFALGAFSGTASACCAPVLAGVVALSGSAGSFAAAAAVGTAYVFGMVAPLFVVASLWDRYDWSDSRWLRGRTFNLRLGGRSRPVHSTALVGGGLLIAMGALTAVVAFTGVAMPRRGWEATVTARLGHYGSVVTAWMGGIPGWVTVVVLLAILGGLVWKAVGQYLDTIDGCDDVDHPEYDDGDDDPTPGSRCQAHRVSPSPPSSQGARR